MSFSVGKILHDDKSSCRLLNKLTILKTLVVNIYNYFIFNNIMKKFFKITTLLASYYCVVLKSQNSDNLMFYLGNEDYV